MTQKMIIATDGSKFSKKAADYGVSLAKRAGLDVVALYVVNMKALEMHALTHHDDIYGYESLNAALVREGEDALAYVARIGIESGVDVVTQTVRGYPADTIVKVAKDYDAGLIVVGNLGKTGLEHLFMGSVSDTVVKKAPCPVLVVRGEVKPL